MATFAVILCEDVEKEGLYIVVKGLVVQEQLGQQTQVLTVDCAHVSINLWDERENRLLELLLELQQRAPSL